MVEYNCSNHHSTKIIEATPTMGGIHYPGVVIRNVCSAIIAKLPGITLSFSSEFYLTKTFQSTYVVQDKKSC